MNQDFAALAKKLDALLQNTLGNKHLINPYFRINKGSPEQTKKYFLLSSSIPRPVILAWILFCIPLNLLKLSFILILSFVLFKQNSIFKQKIENTQVVFLSHGTKRNLTNTNEDAFFDLMPQKIRIKKNLKCTVLYTNQNLFKFRSDNRLLGHKTGELEHILLPKLLPCSEHLKYFLTINYFALCTLISSIRCYFEKPEVSRILICSIPWYFKRATYSNVLVRNRIKEAQKKNNLTSLFLTFEGHSFEQLLTDEIERNNQKTDICFYQHSPIVPSHYGISSFLTQCKFGVTILTTGLLYKEYLHSISKTPNYKVIGTSKSKFIVLDKNVKLKNKIIYAPESTFFATKQFIDLIQDIITESPDYLHCLRLHPDVKLNSRLKLKLIGLRRYKNFLVSSDDLNSDLISSDYLVYRSSAVGIESLKYDLLPIFYADAEFIGLNVLFLDNTAYCRAENSRELLHTLKSYQNKLSKNRKINMFNSYFSSIDYEFFNDI